PRREADATHEGGESRGRDGAPHPAAGGCGPQDRRGAPARLERGGEGARGVGRINPLLPGAREAVTERALRPAGAGGGGCPAPGGGVEGARGARGGGARAAPPERGGPAEGGGGGDASGPRAVRGGPAGGAGRGGGGALAALRSRASPP